VRERRRAAVTFHDFQVGKIIDAVGGCAGH
jgi:hypothetical protein